MSGNVIYLVTVWTIPVIVAITFHEAAHGFVAHLLGDDTAWRLGRVSFNPLKHVDPFGTILLPGLAYGRWTLCAAVRTNYRDLGYAIDDALKPAIGDGRMAAAFAKYGLSYTPPDAS